MTREEAKHIIVNKQLTTLSNKLKYEILEVYFYYEDESDVREEIENNELPKLSDYIIHLLVNNEKPVEINHAEFDLIYKMYLSSLLYGTTNKYLIFKLKEIANIIENDLKGKKELLEPCPCCDYLTISPGEDGICEICPVCFWENFGSGPNGMILDQAKRNFKKHGVMDLQFKEYVDSEGTIKYEKQ
ncbi:CPCC family cysteine-rich protein [uncultured Dokdonia sp.]|uniref:CPCC family cysteine-rich protein n=1 Tax=uncultured Dokdonia sp. TaxID=575653 RepID=UPI00261FD0FA|nr:CPCC family cysteine-rich protein [uncultured Dokdonia sp.]